VVPRGILAQALEATPDIQIARSLNVRGVRTAGTRRTVQNLILNPFYAGLIRYDGELFEGKHPHLIEPADWERLVAARGDRDLGRGRHVRGRPAKLHALQAVQARARRRDPFRVWVGGPSIVRAPYLAVGTVAEAWPLRGHAWGEKRDPIEGVGRPSGRSVTFCP
jgi:Recombinase